jgi:hypothetical protein
MENKFKYRPEVKSIEDLQPGDEFLVGDERWEWDGCIRSHGVVVTADRVVTKFFLIANVPIERNVPYPEGGAEKWELREGDDDLTRTGTLWWIEDGWTRMTGKFLNSGNIYAIPKAKPQDKAKPAPKEYTVQPVPPGNWFDVVGMECPGGVVYCRDLPPGTVVTVQRVSEQGEPR